MSKDEKGNEESIIEEAMERFKEAKGGCDPLRQIAADDIRFARLGDQWTIGGKDIAAERRAEGKPALVINRMPAFIRRVVNDGRQNKPAIKISPVDSGADPDTAEVIEGLIRSIERNGAGAELAYDTALDNAVSGGFGFFRVVIDYAHPDSFDLECRIERIPNPMMVHWDPNSTMFDSSDWEFAFVSEMLTEDEFERKYPNAEKNSWESSTGDAWNDDDLIRVAEYWTREREERTIIEYVAEDGGIQVLREELLPDLGRQMLDAAGLESDGKSDEDLTNMFITLHRLTEKRRRKSTYHKVMRRVITSSTVLEVDEWPGSMIPICPVWGEEVYSDGKRHFRSMIADAKDPQRMFNLWRSISMEAAAMTPRTPFLVEEGALPRNSVELGKWKTSNQRTFPYLLYASGAAMPQRQPGPSIPAGFVQEAINAAEDIKTITGIYDPALGAKSNETSGVAISARQRESDQSTFHFVDNLNRAIRHCGRILVEIIPSVYGPRQTIRILGEDSTEKVIRLGRREGGAKMEGVGGEEPLYDLSVGKYDVSISTGPSYASQREAARETLIEIMSRVPAAAPLIGDILVQHLDFVGADKLAERLRLLLPPQIQQAESGGVPPMMGGQQMMTDATQPPGMNQQKMMQFGQPPMMKMERMQNV
ncbi:MAG: hypothetical protein H7829_17120 [Magnetococcus sp. THC-1_WYH]